MNGFGAVSSQGILTGLVPYANEANPAWLAMVAAVGKVPDIVVDISGVKAMVAAFQAYAKASKASASQIADDARVVAQTLIARQKVPYHLQPGFVDVVNKLTNAFTQAGAAGVASRSQGFVFTSALNIPQKSISRPAPDYDARAASPRNETLERVGAVVSNPIFRVLQMVSVGASAYHGYKRNNSIGWAIGWGLLGGLAPVITPAVALAQGFGKPKTKATP